MNDLMIIFVSVGVAFLLVGLGLFLGSLIPKILTRSTSTDLEIIAYLRERTDDTSSSIEPEVISAHMEKKLYNLERSLACMLGEELQKELERGQ